MQRRVFLIQAGKAVPAVVGAIYMISCGDSTVAPSAVASISSVSTTVNGHTHDVGIPASDQMKGTTTTYTTSATLSHDHMVTLSSSQLTTLGQGGSVTVTSTSSTVTGNHTHDFTFQGKKT
ncbi:MAG TPA: hypothetical protein VFP91_04110 [Vicinamibacterales bacterium]|nr:hypothetical protein [Vicinamibacterales bacterium]